MTTWDAVEIPALPPLSSTHRGTWRPLFLEPLPGSGERVCIGVAGTDGIGSDAISVSNLNRLTDVYGPAGLSFEWTARLAILEVGGAIRRLGFHELRVDGIEGLHIGAPRTGAGRDLKDLLHLGLQQSSAIEATQATEPDSDLSVATRAGRVASAVKRIVVGLRPALRDNFARTFRAQGTGRATAFGFVGQQIVANFTSLGGDSPQALSAQVDRAKARMWDLEQLQKGILHDALGQPMRHASFELLACPPTKSGKEPRTRLTTVGEVREAADTLEKEADKFDIRWRLFRDARELAHSIITREAA
jgi:hypothetical protein